VHRIQQSQRNVTCLQFSLCSPYDVNR